MDMYLIRNILLGIDGFLLHEQTNNGYVHYNIDLTKFLPLFTELIEYSDSKVNAVSSNP